MSTKKKNRARTATKRPRKERAATPKDASKAGTPSPFTRDPRLPAVGTVIQSAYRGRVHEITVREDGFLHEGETYRSLSALARKVTGFAAVNGFLWWGLVAAKKPGTATPAKPVKGTPEQVASVAMDMWGPYIQAVKAKVPSADKKISFDKYHVASHLGEAVDKVRRAGHRVLLEEGDTTLTKTKHLWLRNPENMTKEQKEKLLTLSGLVKKTALAWALKETAMRLWHYRSEAGAKKGWTAWIQWALRSRLEPMRKKAWMIKNHLQGIVNAVVSGTTNALGESVNAKIQAIKRLACGFRNRQRFRNAIYFHCGGLDLYPATLSPTHTTS